VLQGFGEGYVGRVVDGEVVCGIVLPYLRENVTYGIRAA